jgi:hypothetical protein
LQTVSLLTQINDFRNFLYHFWKITLILE